MQNHQLSGGYTESFLNKNVEILQKRKLSEPKTYELLPETTKSVIYFSNLKSQKLLFFLFPVLSVVCEMTVELGFELLR